MSHIADTETFNAKVLSVLDDIEYRRIDLKDEIHEIGRIRSEAYKVANLLTLEGPLVDEVDFDDQAYVFGVYHRGRLVSTVRLHHVTPDHRVTTTFKVFPNELNALLDGGKSFIDPVRLSSDPEFVTAVPANPYVTLRLAVMAAGYLGADHVIQLSTRQHAAFYRRVFNGKQVAQPIIAGGFNIPLGLQTTDVRETLVRLYERYPFFRSTKVEQAALFDRSRGRVPSTPIRPSARECQSADA
jgi:hypothetical protein|nr:acyl-homoserine-lactone synthase [Neorhizobium tomejilense]